MKKLASVSLHGFSNELGVELKKASAFAKKAGGGKFSALLDTLTAQLGSAEAHAFAVACIALLNAPKKVAKVKVEPRPEVVAAFVKRLESNLGDDAFVMPYRQLEHDESITPDEVVAVARTFTTRKPATRPKALQAIWAKHLALLVVRAKSASRAGRSAA